MHEQVMHPCGPRLASTLEAPAAAGSALVVPGFFECAGVFALRLRFTKVRCWLWADGDPPTRMLRLTTVSAVAGGVYPMSAV